MRLVQLIIPGLALLCAPLSAEPGLTLPSGAQAAPLPVIWDEDAAILRLRYIVPALDADSAMREEEAHDDMQWLCNTALAKFEAELGDLPAQGWTGAAVTLMDREVVFGTVDSSAFQLFEWFQFAQGSCTLDLDIYDED
ncbi:MAG: hypothetical protein EA339_07535 [Rhodobacteraceae bacterium]|nr:MAG: hypothetical protein EA339_07535 [Paracoccaceae bacterium]